jgi:hypothetical protein
MPRSNKLAAEGPRDRTGFVGAAEVLGLSDRVLVLYRGRIAAEFTRESATAEKVMTAATGGNMN